MSEFEFLRSMPFAEFTPRNTWLQRIDPRAFLLIIFPVPGLCFIYPNYTSPACDPWFHPYRNDFLAGPITRLFQRYAGCSAFHPHHCGYQSDLQHCDRQRTNIFPVAVYHPVLRRRPGGGHPHHPFRSNDPFDQRGQQQPVHLPVYSWDGSASRPIKDPPNTHPGFHHRSGDCHPVHSDSHHHSRTDRQSTGIQGSCLGIRIGNHSEPREAGCPPAGSTLRAKPA